MITYQILQQYWWLLLSLLGGILVFLLFVQGANTLIFTLGNNEDRRSLIVNSTGRKWEFSFTTLVLFGGAFFASFPLFYSTSFGGAYWLWMLILVTYVLQAVSYEFQSKAGNLLGKKAYRAFLVVNGFFGPFLLGCAVATFFTGSNFVANKEAMGDALAPAAISVWANGWHGLDALANPFNLLLGLAVFFLVRVLGTLYLINNIGEEWIGERGRKEILRSTVPFLLFFLTFVGYVLLKDGYGVNPETGVVALVPYKYAINLIAMPLVLVVFVIGVALVLFGILRTLLRPSFRRGIWPAGIGTVLTVMAVIMLAGLNNTAYYPSNADLQSSLTLANSCSSEFTLKVMAGASLLIPFVLAYIAYAWHCIDRKKLTSDELKEPTSHKY